MVALGQRFTHSFLLALKFLSVYEQRSTLPQSRIRSTAPSEREPGIGAHHSSGCSLKSQVGGRFSSPLRNSKTVSFYHSSGGTPSVTPFGRGSSLREGAGKRSHSSCRSENPGLRAIFIAPTGLRGGVFLPFSEVLAIIIALKNPFYHLADLNIKAQAFSEPVLFGHLIPLPCR